MSVFGREGKCVVWCFVVASWQLSRASYWPWPAVINRPWLVSWITHTRHGLFGSLLSPRAFKCSRDNCEDTSQVEILVSAKSLPGRGYKLVRLIRDRLLEFGPSRHQTKIFLLTQQNCCPHCKHEPTDTKQETISAGPFLKTCPIVAQWGVPGWEVGDVGRSKGVSMKYATCQLRSGCT